MANGRSIDFAGVAQQTERGRKPPAPPAEVAGKNPAPRSTILPFPQPHTPARVSPLLIALAGMLAGIALLVIGLAAYTGLIVLRGLP